MGNELAIEAETLGCSVGMIHLSGKEHVFFVCKKDIVAIKVINEGPNLHSELFLSSGGSIDVVDSPTAVIAKIKRCNGI